MWRRGIPSRREEWHELLPEEIEMLRVCDIAGLDLQADGGTHFARTGEVGPIRVVSHESKGRINKRLRLAIEE
jgi:misacylated tRNA(Ala) deacylase